MISDPRKGLAFVTVLFTINIAQVVWLQMWHFVFYFPLYLFCYFLIFYGARLRRLNAILSLYLTDVRPYRSNPAHESVVNWKYEPASLPTRHKSYFRKLRGEY